MVRMLPQIFSPSDYLMLQVCFAMFERALNVSIHSLYIAPRKAKQNYYETKGHSTQLDAFVPLL